MHFDRVLRTMGEEGLVQTISDIDLATRVRKVAEQCSRENEAYFYRKNPTAVPVDISKPLWSSPAEILRHVGVATSFFSDSPFADVAKHWAQMRYCATLINKSGQISLSPSGHSVVHHHKVAQSEYLGIGFALVVAEHVLRKQYPDWEFSPVDIDVALDSGVPNVGDVRQLDEVRNRPDYILVGRRTTGMGGIKIVVLECKGTHQGSRFAVGQLAKACTQVESVEVAGKTPGALMIATCLLESGVKVYVIDPPGDEDLWLGEPDEFDDMLSEESPEPPQYFDSHIPSNDEVDAKKQELGAPQDGYESQPGNVETLEEPEEIPTDSQRLSLPRVTSIPAASKSWFSRVLAKTTAASALLFAGLAETANSYKVRQGSRTPVDPELALEDEVRGFNSNARFILPGGLSAIGTMYSLPVAGNKSLKVYKGIESSLYERLADGRLGPYLREAHSANNDWKNRRNAQSMRNRAISVGRDGTILMMQLSD